VHPVALTGQHTAAACFDCHRWPDFRSLDFVCSDCHTRPHGFGSEDCASCHTSAGWSSGAMPGHPFPLEHGGASGECSACHVRGDTSFAYCFTCHGTVTTVDFHEARGVKDILGKCLDCHSES
jgi:hypothetical protein